MFSMCAGGKLLLLQNNWQVTRNDNIPAIFPFHHYPLACPEHAGLHLYFSVYIMVTGKDGLESNTDTWHHWGALGETCQMDTVASWVLKDLNNRLVCFKSTRWDRILWTNYLWDCISYNNMEKLFFFNRDFLSAGSICCLGLYVCFCHGAEHNENNVQENWNAHGSLSEFMQLVWKTNLFLAIGDYH